MAVLIEGISIVIRRDRIATKFEGGWENFITLCPNKTLCFDENLVRVGFMARQDAINYADILQGLGLVFFQDNQFIDFAVVDQVVGPTAKCDWLEFTILMPPDSHMTIAVCELVGPHEENSYSVAFPAGWDYENSLSKKFHCVSDELTTRYKYLYTKNGVDVMLDLKSGKEVYVGRSG
jgi:hypothetical protein